MPWACGFDMWRPLFMAGLVLGLALGFVKWRSRTSPSSEVVFEVKAKPPVAAPLCPWRDPGADLWRFFPGASGYQAQTRILSGRRSELAQRLGRPPGADENALSLYRVYEQSTLAGTVLTRRVKGPHGAIELVLAVDRDGRVCGSRLQRQREPEEVAGPLEDPAWRNSFEGKRADNPWKLGVDLPEVTPIAREAAQAVGEGARDLLILLAAADDPDHAGPLAARHH
jgi:hypothetical protein